MTESNGNARTDERVGVLAGDRLCITCAYNLTGQHIVRESCYGLLIVRCPECGTVASLQEYPLLGRWAGRWGIALAGTWLFILLLLWPFSSSVLLGSAVTATSGAKHNLIQFLGERQEVWVEVNDKKDEMSDPWGYWNPGRYHEWLPVHADWWKEQNPALLRIEAREAGMLINWRDYWPLVLFTFIVLPMGMLWACLLPHVRRAWLPLAAVCIGGLAWSFSVIGAVFTSNVMFVSTLGDAAHAVTGSTYFNVALLLLLIPFIVGLLVGRSVLRLAIRALLPPRLRGALSALWTMDGLQPPVPGKPRAPWV